jgi:hypothetical protein
VDKVEKRCIYIKMSRRLNMEDISLFAYFHCSHLVAQSSRIFYGLCAEVNDARESVRELQRFNQVKAWRG